MRLRSAWLVAVFVALVAAAAQTAPASAATNPAEWRSWHLTSADQFRLDPPPKAGSRKTRAEIRELLALQSQRTAAMRRAIRRWNRGPGTAVVPWTRIALRMIADHRPLPPFTARALAMLETGLYDAMVAAADSRRAYLGRTRPVPVALDARIRPLAGARTGSSYAPVNAAMAGAAERILTYLFPNEPATTFVNLADVAINSRLWAGANYRSDVTRARRLGHKVAGLVIARAAIDGNANTGFWSPRPEGESYWLPTPPAYDSPIGAPVGTWKPWLMSAPGALRHVIPGPSPYGSPEFMAALNTVVSVSESLTPDQREIAFFWDDGPRTYTPAGHWFEIAIDLVRAYGLGRARTVRAFALLGAVEADAAIAFFEAKYYWWSIRPVTAIWRLCDGGAALCSDADLEASPERATYRDVWFPLILTPPFPSYPSGHATFSGGAGRILGFLLPNAASALRRLAGEAAASRLYGGLHFAEDNNDGLILGRAVAELAIQRARRDGSGL